MYGVCAVTLLLGSATLTAQERLLVRTTATGGAIYENWSFPTAITTTSSSGGTASIAGSSQLTIPVAVVVGIVNGWTADIYSSYVRSEIRLATTSTAGSPRTSYRLDGPTDTKVRVSGPLVGDGLLFTAGATLPTGSTRLNGEQLDALGVIASPGLRFHSPVLGAGAGVTAGLILTRQLAGWSVALGTSYETRGTYAPAEALQAGLSAGDLRPGNATHLSLAGEHVDGAVRQLWSVGADLYQSGEFRGSLTAIGTTTAGSTGSALSSVAKAVIGLGVGPSLSGTYEVNITGRGSETALFIVGRRRGDYSVDGITTVGSSRTELDGGAQVSRVISSTTALRFGLEGRYQTVGGSSTSESTGNGTATGTGAVTASAISAATFATAGMRSLGATMGVRLGGARSGTSIEPFVRAQVGRLDFGSSTATATGIAGGAMLTAHF